MQHSNSVCLSLFLYLTPFVPSNHISVEAQLSLITLSWTDGSKIWTQDLTEAECLLQEK